MAQIPSFTLSVTDCIIVEGNEIKRKSFPFLLEGNLMWKQRLCLEQYFMSQVLCEEKLMIIKSWARKKN